MSKAEVANEFLGISLNYFCNKLFLGQQGYIQQILNKIKMIDYKPCDTLLASKSNPSNLMNGERFYGPYKKLIGALVTYQ